MTYVTTILADHPVHYWRLAESGAQIVHDIGSSAMFLEGTGQVHHIGFSGIATDGLSMRSPNGGGFIHNSSFWTPPTTPCTIECFVWPLGHYSGVTTPLLVDFGNFGIYDNGAAGTFVPQFYVQDGGTARVINAAAQTVWQWHHLALTYDQVTLKGYVDGAPVGVGLAATAHDTATVLNICQDLNGVRPFDGFITEIAFWSSALSGLQIAAHSAARELTGAPVQLLGGSSGSNGSFTADSAALTSLTNSLFTTYQNAP